MSLTASHSPPFRVQRGLPCACAGDAAALYWRHFGHQIQWLPTTQAQGEALVRALFRPGHALIARSGPGPGGHLIGMAGLRDAGGGLLSDDRAAFLGVFGRRAGWLRQRSATWRGAGASTAAMVLDGVVVAPEWRGRGVARMLVAAAEHAARRAGHRSLRVEVEAGNHAAMAAWIALGFRPIGRARLGWLWSARAHVLERGVQP